MTTASDPYDPYAEGIPLSELLQPSSFAEDLVATFGEAQVGDQLAIEALDERIRQQGLKQQGDHRDVKAGSIFTAPYLHKNLAGSEGYGRDDWWNSVRFRSDLFTLKSAIDRGSTDYGPLGKLVQGSIGLAVPNRSADVQRARAQALYQILSSGVKYIQAAARGRYKIHFVNGALFRQQTRSNRNLVPFDTQKVIDKAGAGGKWVIGDSEKCLWVMLQEGNGKVSFYSHAMKRGRFHHSSLNAGNGVAAAGEWQTDRDGRLVRIYGSSGHYAPEEWRTLWALKELDKAGVLGEAQVFCRLPGNKADMYPAREVLTSLHGGQLGHVSFY